MLSDGCCAYEQYETARERERKREELKGTPDFSPL